MRWYDHFIKYFVGILFIFSGLIKVNDPVGTAIKLKEYFEVFANDFSPLFGIFVPFNLAISVFFVVFEVMLGIALILNYRFRITAWLLLFLIIFFSFLTFYSAFFNKVTDCGCFGDAIPLTPWQSFSKDVVLLVMALFLLIRRNQFKSLNIRKSYVEGIMAFALGFTFILAVYAIRHLPFIDFRPYSIGSNIPVSMKPSEPYRYRYIMEKDGKEFSFDEFPSDTTYVFREMIILNPDARPKITDYHVWNDDGGFTLETFTGNKLFIIFPDVKKANTRKLDRIRKLIPEIDHTIDVSILTASGESDIESFRHEYQLAAPYFYSDMTVLETIIRSNPGLWLLKDGIVMGKWHYNDIPEAGKLIELVALP